MRTVFWYRAAFGLVVILLLLSGCPAAAQSTAAGDATAGFHWTDVLAWSSIAFGIVGCICGACALLLPCSCGRHIWEDR